MMNMEEFVKAAEKMWEDKGYVGLGFHRWFVEWCYNNRPQEPSTWDKIKEKLAALCEQARYDITTKGCGRMWLKEYTSDFTWRCIYSTPSEADLLNKLTAMVKDKQRVTFAEAKIAHNRFLSNQPFADGEAEAARSAINQFFQQSKEEEANCRCSSPLDTTPGLRMNQ